MLIVFWLCACIIIYVYAGYPLMLGAGFLGDKKPISVGEIQPSVSVVIPAHNEEKAISSKLMSVLSQEYPPDKLEILVGDDGSTDATSVIVSKFRPFGVSLLSADHSVGKSAIQNSLVNHTSGEILVFTDADCFFPAGAVKTIVQNFADPKVGLATNCASIINQGETSTVQGEGLYWRYERWLRKEESERGLLAVASGSLFAMRRSLWEPLDPNVGDDFALPLRVAKAGYRNILETRISASTVLTQNQPSSMFRMKVRIISKDLRALLRAPACLNPFQVGKVALGLWSHKLLRWGIPYFLIGLLVSNMFLLHRTFYVISLLAQLAFYLASFLGLLFGAEKNRFPFSVASSFCLVNLAALFGTLHCCTFQSAGRWKPVR